MMNAVLYIHGKGGKASESRHYEPLFPDCLVTGLDYQTFTPRETGEEIRAAAEELKKQYDAVTLIANSIGAYFSLHAGLNGLVREAYFVSPVVDMERLILDLMGRAGVTEEELRARGVIPDAFGEEISWEVLRYVRTHGVDWDVPTHILYGAGDTLIPFATVDRFAREHGATLTVMENGEHWFHTREQIRYLDDWIRSTRT